MSAAAKLLPSRAAPRIVETSLQFGPAESLAATVTLADAGVRRDDGVGLLLLNAGIIHRIGPHRFNVKLARHAARLGVPSIRFDLAGRGDSGPMQGGDDHDRQVVTDIGAAIAALQRQAGTRRHLLFGICSGGDDGLAAAIEHPSIAAIVALDPVIYPSLRWRVSLYASKLRRNGIAGTFARLREIGPLQRHYAMLGNHGRKPPPLPAYVERLRSLAERGVAVTLVYTGSTVDRREFEEQQRKVLARHGLEERIGAEFLPDVDHLVTSLAAQQQVLERLPEWLHAVPDR